MESHLKFRPNAVAVYVHQMRIARNFKVELECWQKTMNG